MENTVITALLKLKNMPEWDIYCEEVLGRFNGNQIEILRTVSPENSKLQFNKTDLAKVCLDAAEYLTNLDTLIEEFKPKKADNQEMHIGSSIDINDM